MCYTDAEGKLMANEAIRDLASQDYKWGFSSTIESDVAPAGLNEDIIRMISAKKKEPEWLLEWRRKSPPPPAPKNTPKPKSMDEVDPEVRKTFEKLGISLLEQERLSGIAVDAVLDSVSVATTFKGQLKELGII